MFGKRTTVQLPPAPSKLDKAKDAAASKPAAPKAPAAAMDKQDQFNELKQRLHRKLVDQIDMTRMVGDERELRAQVREIVEGLCEQENTLLNFNERQRLISEVLDETFGLGPLEILLADHTISDILINGPKQIYVERSGRVELTDVKFRDNAHLMHVIDKIVSQVGRRCDETSPMVDARLPDGSRVNAVIPPLALDGASVSIRRFGADPLTWDDYIRFKSCTPEMRDFLEACVIAHMNIIVLGGTGSGKTTLLNNLSTFIPATDRIVTMEDAAELRLRQPHVVRLESRPPNIEGKGQIAIRDLLINSLRMRPDRIVVGECRGPETLDMLQAMNTGHDGSMTTVHSNGPRDALRRIETMVLMAGMELPLKAIREQVASSMELIVHLERMKDGSRKVVKVSEVQGMESDTIVMQDLFLFKQTGFENGIVQGRLVPSGLRPRFMHKLIDNNIDLPEEIFER